MVFWRWRLDGWLVKMGVESGVWLGRTPQPTDPHRNHVRVRIWKIKEQKEEDYTI